MDINVIWQVEETTLLISSFSKVRIVYGTSTIQDYKNNLKVQQKARKAMTFNSKSTRQQTFSNKLIKQQYYKTFISI